MPRPMVTCLIALAFTPAVAAPARLQTERVTVIVGQPKVLSGAIKGYASAKYIVRARTGQRVTVSLKTSNRSSYMNVTTAGADAALFNGSIQGGRHSLVAKETCDYVINVYLIRSAARRGEKAAYTLTVAVL